MQPSFDDNPFASPTSAGPPVNQRHQRRPFPVFCLVMFITSIVFASIRLLTVPLAVVGYFMLRESGDPQVVAVPFEIITTTGIAVFGILANSLMLARKKIGISLAWILVACVVSSILVGIWQLTYVPGNAELADPAQKTAFMIGAFVAGGFFMVIRMALLGAYCAALAMFSKWLAQSPAQSP